MTPRRVVLDTNVLISAALVPGAPYRVLRHVLENGVLVLSKTTFEELVSRLSKAKFDRYVTREQQRELLADFQAVAEWTSTTGVIHICRDPEGDKFLETAMNGQATHIVSGDRDLLVLDPFENIRIMPPANFLDALVATD